MDKNAQIILLKYHYSYKFHSMNRKYSVFILFVMEDKFHMIDIIQKKSNIAQYH